jgi:hypothetical protein
VPGWFVLPLPLLLLLQQQQIQAHLRAVQLAGKFPADR